MLTMIKHAMYKHLEALLDKKGSPFYITAMTDKHLLFKKKKDFEMRHIMQIFHVHKRILDVD